MLHSALQQLQHLLLGPHHHHAPAASAASAPQRTAPAVAPAAVPRVEQLLATAREHTAQLGALLRSAGDGARAAAEDGVCGGNAEADGEGGHGMGQRAVLPFESDMEKEQLKDEVVRLRAELRLLSERTAGGLWGIGYPCGRWWWLQGCVAYAWTGARMGRRVLPPPPPSPAPVSDSLSLLRHSS